MADRYEQDKTEQKPLKGEKQYREFLLQSLGVSSLLLALLICYFASLPTALAEELAFTADEVESFAGPGARLLAKSKIPESVKTGLVNSSDYIGLGTAAVAYVYRILATLKEYKDYGNNGQNQSVPTTNGKYDPAPTVATGATAATLAGWGNFAAG